MKKLVIAIGILGALFFISAGVQLESTGTNMKNIKSQSGDSIAEAYYQEMGGFSKGLGTLCFGLGIITIGVTLYKTTNEVKVY